jgi:hypothetical protein
MRKLHPEIRRCWRSSRKRQAVLARLEANWQIGKQQKYIATSPLNSLAVPMSLVDSLTARLDRLGAAKEVAQIGSVIGR